MPMKLKESLKRAEFVVWCPNPINEEKSVLCFKPAIFGYEVCKKCENNLAQQKHKRKRRK